jgi:hypothetical protein
VGTSKITGQFWKAFRLDLGCGYGNFINNESPPRIYSNSTSSNDGAPSDRGQQHGTGTAFVEGAMTAGAITVNETVL